MENSQIHDVEILGDSILKGVQVNPANGRYYTKNDIDIPMLSEKFSLSVKNDSHFGCTVTKGKRLLTGLFEKGLKCEAVVMDFGGNDCDFDWSQIASNPEQNHMPKTPLPDFLEEYRLIIRRLKENNIVPILTTLPPLDAQKFFDWWCRNLNKENVMKWLGGVETIYKYQENYSRQIQKLAEQEKVLIVDIRSAFLKCKNVASLICEDGTHPNTNGQKVITQAFYEFAMTIKGTEWNRNTFSTGIMGN